jgi:predicted anti-sigma-YlaC factor YlaD
MNTITKLDCKTCRSHMEDLLLDQDFADRNPQDAAHLEECAACRAELHELRATFALLDEYTAPEPSPYFDSKLHARLREVQEHAPESLFERMRSFFLFSTGRVFQPAMATALVIVLAIGGGGTFWQLHGTQQHAVHQNSASAVVNDLNVLDNNAQAEQQMGQLLDQSGSEDGDTPPTS